MKVHPRYPHSLSGHLNKHLDGWIHLCRWWPQPRTPAPTLIVAWVMSTWKQTKPPCSQLQRVRTARKAVGSAGSRGAPAARHITLGKTKGFIRKILAVLAVNQNIPLRTQQARAMRAYEREPWLVVSVESQRPTRHKVS